MESNYPLVTVFTLIYNTNPKFVIEAIESIRANNYPNLQHIIIDDCSPNPEPKRVVKQWIDRENYPCEFYEHKFNYGVCNTLNHVLELARGKYIFGCSDDIISSEKISLEVEILENLNDTYAATYSDAYLIDENGKLLNEMFINKYRKFNTLPDGNIFNELCFGNFLPVMSMIFKTKYIKELGGYDEKLEFEDYDLNLRLFRKYKIKYIDIPLAYYRVHSSSLMFTKTEWRFDLLRIYKKFLDVPLMKEKYLELQRELILKESVVMQFKAGVIWVPVWRIIYILFGKNQNKMYLFLCAIKNRNIPF